MPPPTVAETVVLLALLEIAMLSAGGLILTPMPNIGYTLLNHVIGLNGFVGLDHNRKVC